MQPTKSDVFTPRAAAHWVRNWLRRNDLEYDFWRTPQGPLIFNKEEHGYIFKCPMSDKWIKVADINEFILLVSESLAIAFGYRKETL